MANKCQTCSHPERDRIEQELAICKTVAEVANRYGIKRRSMSDHRKRHMTQEQIARLRHNLPDKLDFDIDELTRRGGQDAMIGLKRLNLELQERARLYDEENAYNAANRARSIQFKVYCEQMRLAAMYPGEKNTVNNNLVVADGQMVFQMVEKALAEFPEARRKLAVAYREWSQSAMPPLEHAP
jgi:hypothetical protein